MDGRSDYAFLHGGAQGGWVWKETVAALESQTGGGFGRALALDVPGCGARRGEETGALDVPAIVAGLVAAVEAAGFADVVLVGHSQAGTLLPLMLAERPALFRRLVYVSCLAPLPGQTALGWRESMPPAGSALGGDAPVGSRARFGAMFCNDMTPAAADAFLDRMGDDRWPAASYAASGWRYDHLDATPADYVLCLRDAVLPPLWQETFAERLRARVIRVDAGHQVMNTRPHALAEILRIEAAA